MKVIYKEIQGLNQLDPATHAERLGKLAEEFGELAMAINKSTGRKFTDESEEEIKKELLGEIADVIQNTMSIADGFEFTLEDIVLALSEKNSKWIEVIRRRNKDHESK